MGKVGIEGRHFNQSPVFFPRTFRLELEEKRQQFPT
jgi:hypothetical protein